ncbi:SDR family NAD(P)-dependent oxidoreductase [Deinococcus radiopugnans]|uniref:SDR family NAD(P)-dependent oxidoreductase n=1 Tax=Deinococcus radiopugnans TaxID=57497 RepID=UPI003612DC72
MTTIASPLAPRATALEVVQGLDLNGKTAVITGASSGIGVETARALLSAGASVILAVRDTGKGEKIAAELRESTGNQNAQVIELDLASLAQVREGRRGFWRQLPPFIS